MRKGDKKRLGANDILEISRSFGVSADAVLDLHPQAIDVLHQVSRAAKQKKASRWDLSKLLHPKQLEFVRCRDQFKAASCSRQSGKTQAVIHEMLDVALEKPYAKVLYIAPTREMAKEIVWHELKMIAQANDFTFTTNEGELSMVTANNSIIRLRGCASVKDIEKPRGQNYDLVVIDEAQMFPAWIRILVDATLGAAMIARTGRLILIGTPGIVPLGYFYDACHGKDGYTPFHWTIADNTFIPDANKQSYIIRERQKRGLNPDGSQDTPYIRREFFGEWCDDSGNQVYRFNQSTNSIAPNELLELEAPVTVMGIDTGHNDKDAICVCAFSYTDGKQRTLVVDEWVRADTEPRSFSALMKRVDEMRVRWQPTKIVIDPATGGTKLIEELKERYSVFADAAQKVNKNDFIEMLNDDLTSGRLKLDPYGHAASEVPFIHWTTDERKNRQVVSGLHSDIWDALLYAWRECRSYRAKETHFIQPKATFFGRLSVNEHKKRLSTPSRQQWWK